MAGVALVALSGLGSGYLQMLRAPAAYASTTCTVTANTDDSSVTTAGTLSGCLNDLATAPAGPFTILLNTSVTLGPGGLAAVDPANQVDITIDGQGNTIDGQGAANLQTRPGFEFTLESTDTLTVTDVTLTDLSAGRRGGALFAQLGTSSGFDVTLDGVTIQDSNSTSRGGAVYIEDGDLTITDSQFLRNTGRNGGGVYVWDGNTSITGSRFEGNNAVRGGGALYVGLSNSTSYSLTVSNSAFLNNASGYDGGAIYADGDMLALRISNTRFSENRAGAAGSFDGGAIYHSSGQGSIQIDSSYFNLNYATEAGGAIYSEVPLTITNSVFVDDSAAGTDGGGAIYQDDTLIIRGSLFVGNEAVTDHGGAIMNMGDYVTKVSDSVFVNNQSGGRGGAIYAHYAAQVYRSTFIGNQSADDGGAVKSGSRYDGTVEYPLVVDSYFRANTSATEGGAIWWANGTVTDPSSITVVNSSFIANSALRGGAMFRPRSSTVSELGTITGSTFANNTADDTGGAIWDGGSLALTNTTLVSNVATAGGGGAIYMDDSSIGASDTLLLDFVTLSANDAPAGRGAAMWLVDTAVTAAMSVIDDTNAVPDPCEFVGSTTMDDTSVYSTRAFSCQLFGQGSDSFWNVGDFQLGALADNGGLTDTLMPASTSPLVVSSTATNQNLSVGAVGDDQRKALRVAPFTLGAVQFGAEGAPGGSSAPVAAAGDAQATVTAPTTVNGGTPTSWVIQAFNADDTEIMATDDTCAISAATGSCTVTGLTNGSAYQFTAVSANALGTGRVSPVSNTVTPGTTPGPNPPTPPAPPVPASAPQDVRAVAGDGSAIVSWAAPESSGAFPVSTYKATAAPGGRGCLVPATELECEISGLSNGVPYAFTVEALTGAGWSPRSAPSNSVTPAPEPQPDPTVPGPVRDVRLVRVMAAGVATLSWRVPVDDGGAPIRGYRVGYRLVGEDRYTRVRPDTDRTRVRITGLTPGAKYYVRIKAGNRVGYGPGVRYSQRITIPVR